MICIKYIKGSRTVGMLVFRDQETGYEAIGGITPEEMGVHSALEDDEQTLVYTDKEDDIILEGWVHPDNILGPVVI